MITDPPLRGNGPIHILFIGAGAVGCFYASRLHHPSYDVYVSLVCRSNYSTISRSGVVLETRSFGTYTFVPHAVFPSVQEASRPGSAPQRGWDYVVLTTKALPDVVDDAATIAPLVRDGKTCIVLIQNGFGVEAPHRSRFPCNPIISGVTVISAELVNPGTVRQHRWTRVSFGPYSDGGRGASTLHVENLQRRGAFLAKELVRILTEHGKLRDAEVYDEIGLQAVRWHKLCINSAMNPSSILSGEIESANMVIDSELRHHLKACMEEVFAAAPAVLGRPLPANLATPEEILLSTERNKGSKPSMLLDWEAGRPLELEVILGNPVRIAREMGHEMGRLQSVYALLRSAQERKNLLKAKNRASIKSNL